MVMRLKEHIEGDQKKYVLTKEELIQFVMRVNNLMLKVEKE